MNNNTIKELSRPENLNLAKKDLEKYPNKSYSFNYEGLDCTLKRVHQINWNGYVQLPTNHKFYNLDYDELTHKLNRDGINIHGDLTYGQDGMFGFDTLHLGDFCIYNNGVDNKEIYWNYEMVEQETKKLAKHLSKY
jgi:hypothetical protein